MLRKIGARLTYANVTATLALFVALGGTGYAALRIPRNSVGTSQIRPRAVRTSKLANGAVKRDKLTKGAVSGDKVGTNTLTGRNINEKTLSPVPGALISDYAGRAQRAASAAAADTLQGKTASDLEDKCPAGTVSSLGACIESTTRPPDTWGQAAISCRANGRLPDAAELTAFAQGFRGSGPELSAQLSSVSGAFTVNTQNGELGTVDFGTSVPYRCIRPLTNHDPNSGN